MRRVVVIPFQYPFDESEVDFNISAKLQEERDNVAVKALRLYAELRDNNYRFAGDYQLNACIERAEGVKVNPKSMVADFLVNMCELDEKAWTPTQALYEAFSEINSYICPMNYFSEILLSFCEQNCIEVRKSRNRIAKNSNPVWGFRGIKLKAIDGANKNNLEVVL